MCDLTEPKPRGQRVVFIGVGAGDDDE
jgi:hypothetical protein